MSNPQLDLFAHVVGAYAQAGARHLDNDKLYADVAQRAGLAAHAFDHKIPIGQAGQRHSPIKRAIRWYQQTLKRQGVIKRVADARGVWRLTEAAGNKLTKAAPTVKMIAFSTHLGVAIWGASASVFPDLGEPIALCITSPPYPLRKARAYGNCSESDYVDFICSELEPIVKHLAPGGSICLNLSNDIFLRASPGRSLYRERLVLALTDRLGLTLMDTLIWVNKSKPPGPIQWASKERVHLNVAWEPIYWFSSDPSKVKSNNRRVLEPHTARHLALMARGGEKRTASYGDGAYQLHEGSFGNATAGRIPLNVLERGHACADTNEYRRDAKALGMPVHGAMQPLSIPDFLIRFLTDVGELVVDTFGGTTKTGMAAERLGRRWISTEIILDYIRPSGERFRPYPGFWMNPGMEQIRGPLPNAPQIKS